MQPSPKKCKGTAIYKGQTLSTTGGASASTG
ncbi:hypothetical protein A2U01_0095174, partial [Trifolium medium]|nr:hypothetical protein [Trifolium medium]